MAKAPQKATKKARPASKTGAAKPAAKKTAAKKPAAVKTPAKKAAAKKPAAKKAAAKKPATAKASVKSAAAASSASTASAKASSKNDAATSQASAQSSGSNHSNDRSDQSEPIWTKDPKIPSNGNIAEKVWRLIAMIAFAFIGYFALLAFIILAAMQFTVSLLKSGTNPEIRSIMLRLKAFMNEVYDFLMYDSDEMPFPFRPFPADPAEK